MEALRSERTYDPERDLTFWLHGIAMNIVRRRAEQFYRARARHAIEPVDADGIEALHEQLSRITANPSIGPEEALSVRQEVGALLAALEEQDRDFLILFYFEHHQDYDAVAAALGIRPGTARVRLCRALKAAREGSAR